MRTSKASGRQERGLTHLLSGLMALAILVTPLAAVAASDIADDPTDEDGDYIIVGGQDRSLDAKDDRDAKFEKNREVAQGGLVGGLHFSVSDQTRYFQLQSWDISQRDEGFRVRAGFGEQWRVRGNYQSLPYLYGSGARFVLGRQANDRWGPTYRIGDFSQQLFEDPDGNGVPFFTDATETANDNALVQGLTNDLLTGFGDLSIGSRRRGGGGGVTYHPTEKVSVDFDARTETRHGTKPLGTGTYQRITDVNGDGMTDSDYFFSVRGLEMPEVIDTRTTLYDGAVRYREEKWFVDVTGDFSDFNNDHIGLTYDNPFWFNSIEGTSGSRRGLWEEGRASYEPSNHAWNVGGNGGFNFAKRTRLTAGVSYGQRKQEVDLLPITINPALIGTVDLNRDGVVDANDNPTLTTVPGLGGSINGVSTIGTTVNAKTDVLAYHALLTSKPVDGLTLTGRFRRYEYQGKEGIQVVPGRAEYIESRMKLDFKGGQILHVPLDWSRTTAELEAGYKFMRELKVKAFGGRKSYSYDQYKSTEGNETREQGSRAVKGTDDDFFGLTALFGYDTWLSGWATWKGSKRKYDGDYTPGFSGELSSTRQFDIAERDRNQADVRLSLMPTNEVTFGLGYRLADDDYPESEYGMQKSKSQGWNVDANWLAAEDVMIFAYADMSEWDADMHLRTKCANCPDPPGASPWDIPNYDWFSDYTDESLAYGGGFDWSGERGTTVNFVANYVAGEIKQKTRNNETPTELNPGNPLFGETAFVALGYDFPNQETKMLATEVRLTQRVNDRLDVGGWYKFEDFQLTDFQWDGMDPYGANFLARDDATRFMLLDARYSDYQAHIGGVYLRARL